MPSLPQFIDDIRSRIQPLNGKVDEFAAFTRRLHIRREWGRHQYADSSKTRPARYLAQMIEEELVDVPSWTFDLFSCPQELEAADRDEWLQLSADAVSLWFRLRKLAKRLPLPPGFNCHVGSRKDWRSDATGDIDLAL